ncbi:ABC transporter ATP-binding protein [Novosphingobium taihuense]|uniref:ABC-2 type transport system ATP-binding protein n=1 Tax=Novosphingobium taihuense TaxID=260085 RepID=A0A7W7ETY8_9SPHN|nr:ABC transporter ATP-binding protein [Novosphingobium taihuense]MBB4613381.1 ABC-2 type transport system ATP-binding protein [Novosphingobium taihuense]TWH80887.1 ABC-2 type transport system ATP-binding protein [Novosphingobium taihuense]
MASQTPEPIVSIVGLDKIYQGGFHALKSVDLEIFRGEIFALLGPNGAGKTTLIGIVCGLVRATGGTVIADGHDIARDYRAARAKIGLVPQELSTDMFETVWHTVNFSRGLFGKPRDHALVEQILRDLSLWDKRHSKIAGLSGGMKRRVLIAKALSHEPTILFLDEPTAGVDVELRRDMWDMVRRLRERGVTIILTTHYIEEAEEMADRIGVIDGGKIILIDEKHALMERLGRTRVTVGLAAPLDTLPPELADEGLALTEDGASLVLTLTGEGDGAAGAADLIKRLFAAGIDFRSVDTARSSLEEIFVGLVEKQA